MPTTTAKRPTSAVVPDQTYADYNTIAYRLNRFLTELNQRSGGTPMHPDMMSANLSIAETASTVIDLAQRLASAVDARFPIR